MKTKEYVPSIYQFAILIKSRRFKLLEFVRFPNYLLVGFLFFISALNMAVASRWQKGDKASNVILQNEIVRFEFEPAHGGLVAMVDLASGTNHVQEVDDTPSLWNLTFSHGLEKRSLSSTQFPCSRSEIEKLSDGSARATFEWPNLEWDLERLDIKNTKNKKRDVALGRVSVRVSIELPRNSGIASWRISVDNNADMWGLWDVDFPSVNGFLASGQYDIARPARPGLLLKACAETVSGTYRGNDMSMQFLCAMKGGNAVYMAAHDPHAWFKSFTLEPGGKFFIKTFAENMGIHGSDYKDPFPVMLGVYHGGWMEACKIYRKFAVTAPWLSEGKLSQRSSVPDALKNIGLWIRVEATDSWPETNDWKKNTLLIAQTDAQRYFDVPIGAHWYLWNEIAYDNNYPHFFPAKPGFEEQARYLTSHGIIIMPYINGRIVDTFNDDFGEYLPYSTKDQVGETYIELYGPKKGRMTPMCPYTEFWQDKVAKLVEDLNGRMGVNAAYIDQVAGAVPKLCFDKSHGHPLGGGSWWVDGYKEMFRKVQTVAHDKGRDMIITSETNAEYFISDVDAFLQLPNDGRGIPMLESVYSGYTLYFGTPADLNKNTDRGWIMHQGRSFIWGCQNGWMGFELFKPEYAKRASYLKEIGKYRVATKKFLTYGELVDVIGHSETVTEKWNAWFTESTATLPVIQGAIWKAEDGSLGVFVVNYLEKEGVINLNIDPANYGLVSKSGKYTIARIRPDGNRVESVRSVGTINRTVKLGSWGISVFEIKATP